VYAVLVLIVKLRFVAFVWPVNEKIDGDSVVVTQYEVFIDL
jgi:hypothetical protein